MENLGIEEFGQAFYEIDGSAHGRYGVGEEEGTVVILRPDATIGRICQLSKLQGISNYFGGFLVVEREIGSDHFPREDLSSSRGTGEVDIQTQNGRIENGAL